MQTDSGKNVQLRGGVSVVKEALAANVHFVALKTFGLQVLSQLERALG